MKPKAIFLDIDGTLTEPGTNVPPASALEAIRRAQEAGNYVFLCTGRNYAMLSPLLKYGFDGVVASSGGYVACRDEVIYDSPMTDEERDRMSRLLKENGIFRTIECVEELLQMTASRTYSENMQTKGKTVKCSAGRNRSRRI